LTSSGEKFGAQQNAFRISQNNCDKGKKENLENSKMHISLP